MRAHKMFRQLGYDRRYKRGCFLVYEKTVNKVCIAFDLEEYTVEKGCPLGSLSINYEDLQAINQQIQELKWERRIENK